MIECKQLTVFEYDEISRGNGKKQLPNDYFSELRDLILPKNRDVDNDDDIGELSACMTLCSSRGEEVIRVKNHVGIISLKSGFVIEILPKTADIMTDERIPLARLAVTEMLKASGKIPYKSFGKTKLYADKMNLFEIYIRLFVDEVAAVYKKGLKSDYIVYEANEKFLKGKLTFGEHIRRNSVRKDNFYVRYDLFDFNCAENRLIKAALIYLKSKSNNAENKRDICKLLDCLDEIIPSYNYESDFAKCCTDRTTKDYGGIINMCRVFLSKKSFASFGGENKATALLFPMEKLFESFFAEVIKNTANEKGYYVKIQDESKYLFQKKNIGQFKLRPDIVLQSKRSKDIVIIDTKWKRLNINKSNYGISQADMYQMYAYHTRYDNVRKAVLVYPMYNRISIPDYTTVTGDKDVTVSLVMFDMIEYFNDGSIQKSERYRKYIYPFDKIFEH